MGGTDIVDDPGSGDFQPRFGIPAPVASIRVDGIRAFRMVDEEDGPILIVTDGDTTVEFLCGLSGRSYPAALGAQRLAEATNEYAVMVRAGGSAW